MTTDARWSRASNLKRRLAMMRYHATQRDPVTGKSQSAVSGGRAAWAKRTAATPGGARALGLEMVLRRWHPDLETSPPAGESVGTRRRTGEKDRLNGSTERT